MADMDRLTSDFIAYYADHIAVESRPFEGLEDALDLLRHRAIGWRSAPTSWNGCQSGCWTSLAFSGRFAAICGADTFGVQKPDPTIFRETVARAGGDVRPASWSAMPNRRRGRPARRGARDRGQFGYTDVPIAELKPDRLIHHMRDLPAAAHSLMTA